MSAAGTAAFFAAGIATLGNILEIAFFPNPLTAFIPFPKNLTPNPLAPPSNRLSIPPPPPPPPRADPTDNSRFSTFFILGNFIFLISLLLTPNQFTKAS